MDMSVKLNLSYPAAQPATPAATPAAVVDKSVENSSVASVAASAESKNSQQDMSQNEENVKAAAEDIQKFFQSVKRNLEFSTDESSGRLVVKVIASDSGLVIRQIPNEEVLKLAESLSDASSLLFRAEV
ncbi:flagellar biosynthesis protein FlaG [Pseudomonas sp. S25]|uniref:Flagellar biosynthesis protein FlaG n=1 Tax=Pseudomonas maioricensis TaxID=1766623 RepID=A0ABS9ZKC4_9PSED|nr:flagellar protein FlaG [Pseudomonas sp. S25]MCI8210556.1 flagellar biosynthesis protein FlaG [Pseudomonas sp. S25]